MDTFLNRFLQLQTELKAPKGQVNKFGGYKYRSCEDILEAVKPLLGKYRMTLTIGDDLLNVGERYYISVLLAYELQLEVVRYVWRHQRTVCGSIKQAKRQSWSTTLTETFAAAGVRMSGMMRACEGTAAYLPANIFRSHWMEEETNARLSWRRKKTNGNPRHDLRTERLREVHKPSEF